VSLKNTYIQAYKKQPASIPPGILRHNEKTKQQQAASKANKLKSATAQRGKNY